MDAIGGARNDDGAGGDNEVQRTMLQIVTELDGFDSRGNIKVNRKTAHTLDLTRYGIAPNPEPLQTIAQMP